MIIFSKDTQAKFYVEAEALPGVKRIAKSVAGDLNLVLGADFTVEEAEAVTLSAGDVRVPRIIAATLGHSAYLEQLFEEGVVSRADIEGKWEVYSFTVLPATIKTPETLLIAGSDKRGTIYGLYHISELLGVSPWVWFADSAPEKKDEFEILPECTMVSKVPSVKYRGIFINDEWPSYGNWTFSHFGGFTAQMYEHVFELILRLKGNYLWPAMWTSNFSCDGPGLLNAELADEMGIVMSNSHHEPCLRHSEEWDLVKGDDTPYGSAWNFDKNREGLTNYWRDGLKRNGGFENIITMGMRGERDSEILGRAATLQENIDYLKEVITTQNALIQETISEDLDETQRMLAIYKEVELYFHGDDKTEGLKYWDGLDGITCMLCEDNFGNMRTLPEDWQRDRKGGWGMYYHFDYHGDPVSYEWINSTHIARTCDQMSQAYEYGIRDIWIVNTGDLKPQELPISYFMDLAYDYDKWGANSPDAVQTYLAKWVRSSFPNLPRRWEDLETLLEGYTRLNYIRKPEALYEDTYHPTHYGEADAILEKADKLIRLSTTIYDEVVGTADEAAYIQLVYYPVQASMNQLRMMLYAGKNHTLAKQGAMLGNRFADKASDCIDREKALQKLYHGCADGKWDKIMLSEHVGFHNWNDEECAYPIGHYVMPANKPRMIVTVGNDTLHTCGGDWTGKRLRQLQLLDPSCETAAIHVYNGAWDAFEVSVSTDADWLILPQSPLRLESFLSINVGINRKNLQAALAENGNVSVIGKAEVLVKTDFAKVYIDVWAVAVTEVPEHYVPVLPEELRGKVEESELGLTMEVVDYLELNELEGTEYRILPGFGKFEAGLKPFPPMVSFVPGENAPNITYSFYAPHEGNYEMTLLTAPNNPAVKGNDMCLGIRINEGDILKVATVEPGYVGGERSCRQWAMGVLNQIHETSFVFHAKAGENQLTIYACDPDVTVERILIREAEGKRAYGYLGEVPSWLK